jgi:amidase
MQTHLTRRDFLKTAAVAGTAAIAAPALKAFAADEFYGLDGLAQAQLVADGEVTALELVDAAIARAEALNPKLNAIVTPMYEQARERAQGELPEGPFKGVPTLMKDLIDYEGVRTAFGSRMMLQNIAAETHPLGHAMERMGFVIMGKSATPEFGLLPTTEPSAFGPTNNPWDLSRTPGGSSGGTAAAVAAGIVPIAQGSDGGGSIRIPSSNCGLFGMKPTRGRVITTEEPPYPGDLSVRGFLSRSVRDNEIALGGAMAPDTALPPLSDWSIEGKQLRIAMSTTTATGEQPHEECVNAIKHTAKLLADLGHRVEEAAPPIDGEQFSWAMLTLWSNIPNVIIKESEAATGSKPPEAALEGWTWGLAESFAKQDADDLQKAVDHMKTVTQQMNAFLDEYDMILTPVLGSPPARTGDIAPNVAYNTLFERVVQYAAFTPPANAAGLPAMSLPLYWTPDGLPVGSQFVGTFGEERKLYALAKQLEQAQPWIDRWPEISAKYI